MNKMMKTTVMTACLSLLSTGVMAQSALQQLKLQAGDEAVAASSHIEIPHAAIQPGGFLVSVPLNAKDVFAGCQAVDAKAMSLVAWTLPQAIGVMQHCLDQRYNQDGYTVTAKAAKFTVPMCPPVAGRVGCQALKEVDGISIEVRGQILTGDSVLMDLGFSLNKRGGSLLGWHAALDNEAVILN